MHTAKLACLLLVIAIQGAAVPAAPHRASQGSVTAPPLQTRRLRVALAGEGRTRAADRVDVHADPGHGLTFVVRDRHGVVRRTLGVLVTGSRMILSFESPAGRGRRAFDHGNVLWDQLDVSLEPEVARTVALIAALPPNQVSTGEPVALPAYTPPDAEGHVACERQGPDCACTCSHGGDWVGLLGCTYFEYASVVAGRGCTTHETCSADASACAARRP